MSNLQIKFKSLAGSLTFLIDTKTEPGKILATELVTEKIGGLKSFKFNLDRRTNVPLFVGALIEFWFNNVRKFTGYASVVPYAGSNEEVLIIEGVGYWTRLTLKSASYTFAATTIGAIIAALDLTGTDVNYNPAKINAPTIPIANIEFQDKTTSEILTTLVTLANNDYNNTQYVCGVDANRDLYFNPLPTAKVDSYFEGTDFQAPAVSFEDTICNRVIAYRALSGTSTDTDYVDTFEDLNSQSAYGIKERKIVFPDFADSTTINNLCLYYLTKYKAPIRKIELITTTADFLADGYFGISVKRETYQFLVNDFDTLAQWDVSHAPGMTVTIDATKSVTGRTSMKVVAQANATGQYIEYVLPVKITSPKKFRMYIYFDTSVTDVRFQFIDSKSSVVEVQTEAMNNLAANQWLKYEQVVTSTLLDNVLEVDSAPGLRQVLEVDPDGVNAYVLEIITGLPNFLQDLARVRVLFNGTSNATFYLDRLDCLANSWIYSKLSLEQTKYTINGNKLLSSCTFGEKSADLIDEIVSGNAEGNAAWAIFSKG